MSKYKKQHFIPACYLKAWSDPSTPKGQTPYIWVFSKDGNSVKKKSPNKMFRLRDFYTIKDVSGERNLTLEHGLSELEGKFCVLRDNKLSTKQILSQEDHIILCLFVAAMCERTQAMQEHQQGQWQKALDSMEGMRKWAKTAKPEEIKAVSRTPQIRGKKRKVLSYRDVKKIAEEPIQHLLLPTLNITAKGLSLINCAMFVTTDTQPGFITSDDPCVWSDPEAYKRPPFYRNPGLEYESIEITMPISPKLAIWFNRKGYEGYINAREKIVDYMNTLTRFNAHKYFIVNSNCKKDIWFIQNSRREEKIDLDKSR